MLLSVYAGRCSLGFQRAGWSSSQHLAVRAVGHGGAQAHWKVQGQGGPGLGSSTQSKH